MPGDRRDAHERPVALDDLGELRQAVVDTHDVAGLDAGEPHRGYAPSAGERGPAGVADVAEQS